MKNTEKSMEELADELHEAAHVEERRAELFKAEFLVHELLELEYVTPEKQEQANEARNQAWLNFERAKALNTQFYMEIEDFDRAS